MKILFISAPLSEFKIYKDTTYSIMVEAANREYQIFHCEPRHIIFKNSIIEAIVEEIEIFSQQNFNIQNWYKIKLKSIKLLSVFDKILIRKDPPFDIEYVTLTWLLELAEQSGTIIFNKPKAIRNYSEKLAIAKFPQFITPTIVSSNINQLKEFHSIHGDVIFKPLYGMGGMGIFYIRRDAINLNVVIEQLSNNGMYTIMAQRFIPEITYGDKRILIIDGKPIPYAVARFSQQYGEIRANLALGGKASIQKLSNRDLLIAETLGPIMKKQGLILVGLDIIGEWLTEINVTSPTGFQEITSSTGFNVAATLIDALEAYI